MALDEKRVCDAAEEAEGGAPLEEVAHESAARVHVKFVFVT